MSINGNEHFLKMRFGKYSAFFEGKSEVSIPYLASATSTPVNTVLHELQQLINMGYFGSAAYINYLTKSLVLSSAAACSPVRQPPARPVNPTPTVIRPNVIRPDVIRPNVSRPPVTRVDRSGRRSGRNASSDIAPAESSGLPDVKNVYSSTRSLLLIGGIALCAMFVKSAGNQLDAIAQAGFLATTAAQWWIFAKSGLWLASGVGALAVRAGFGKRALRYKKYRAFVGSEKSADLKQLAAAAGVSPGRARSDIETMIDKGLWGSTAILDVGAGKLMLIPEHSTAQSEDKPAEKAAEKPGQETDNQFYHIITEIRELNDSIVDPNVSARISRIEELTGKIFRIVEEKPEKLPQIKSFMSYYLPTTLKLLRSYNTFEKQDIQGDNIDAAKKDIERILDTLVKGYSQQLDQLFKDDAMDISTDIDVLETMMKRDGLSGTNSDFTVAEGH